MAGSFLFIPLVMSFLCLDGPKAGGVLPALHLGPDAVTCTTRGTRSKAITYTPADTAPQCFGEAEREEKHLKAMGWVTTWLGNSYGRLRMGTFSCIFGPCWKIRVDVQVGEV